MKTPNRTTEDAPNATNDQSTLTIYVRGGGGLGNILFQIATAIYYKETLGGTIVLRNWERMGYGTSNMFGKAQGVKINGKDVPYTSTIFKKFSLYEQPENAVLLHPRNCEIRHEYDPKSHKNILLEGGCQDTDLFKKHLHKIPGYLNLQDKTITAYVKAKYKNIDKGVCIGLRVGSDFKHMKKITRNSYINALEKTENHEDKH